MSEFAPLSYKFTIAEDKIEDCLLAVFCNKTAEFREAIAKSFVAANVTTQEAAMDLSVDDIMAMCKDKLAKADAQKIKCFLHGTHRVQPAFLLEYGVLGLAKNAKIPGDIQRQWIRAQFTMDEIRITVEQFDSVRAGSTLGGVALTAIHALRTHFADRQTIAAHVRNVLLSVKVMDDPEAQWVVSQQGEIFANDLINRWEMRSITPGVPTFFGHQKLVFLGNANAYTDDEIVKTMGDDLARLLELGFEVNLVQEAPMVWDQKHVPLLFHPRQVKVWTEVLKQKKKVSMVVGSNGTGKAFSMLYLILQLFRQRKTVVWESYRRERVWAFIPVEDADVADLYAYRAFTTESWRFDPTECKLLDSDDAFYLVDCSPLLKNPHERDRKWASLSAGTRNGLASPLVTLPSDSDVAVFYMPPWTEEEIIASAPVFRAPQRTSPALSLQTIKQRLGQFGGIVKHIFYTPDYAKAFVATVLVDRPFLLEILLSVVDPVYGVQLPVELVKKRGGALSLLFCHEPIELVSSTSGPSTAVDNKDKTDKPEKDTTKTSGNKATTEDDGDDDNKNNDNDEKKNSSSSNDDTAAVVPFTRSRIRILSSTIGTALCMSLASIDYTKNARKPKADDYWLGGVVWRRYAGTLVSQGGIFRWRPVVLCAAGDSPSSSTYNPPKPGAELKGVVVAQAFQRKQLKMPFRKHQSPAAGPDDKFGDERKAWQAFQASVVDNEVGRMLDAPESCRGLLMSVAEGSWIGYCPCTMTVAKVSAPAAVSLMKALQQSAGGVDSAKAKKKKKKKKKKKVEAAGGVPVSKFVLYIPVPSCVFATFRCIKLVGDCAPADRQAIEEFFEFRVLATK